MQPTQQEVQEYWHRNSALIKLSNASSCTPTPGAIITCGVCTAWPCTLLPTFSTTLDACIKCRALSLAKCRAGPCTNCEAVSSAIWEYHLWSYALPWSPAPCPMLSLCTALGAFSPCRGLPCSKATTQSPPFFSEPPLRQEELG